MATTQSFSRQLTDEYVRTWKEWHPDGDVAVRDVASTSLSPLSAEWIAAAYTPEANLTPEQRDVLELSDELVAELQSADEIVVGVPMHNFSVPGALKLWIDQIARPGKTFSYAGGAPAGLLTGKRATLVVTSGGVYHSGTPLATLDHAEPYLRSVLGFLGITDVRVIRASGTARARDEQSRQAVIDERRTALKEAAIAA